MSDGNVTWAVQVDKLEKEARQARKEYKEQEGRSLAAYLERRAAEFRVAVAELEVFTNIYISVYIYM